MTWLDGDRWDPDQADVLVRLLYTQYKSESSITQVLQDAKIDIGSMVISGDLRLRWTEMTRSIHGSRGLRRLVQAVALEFPALGDLLEAASADPHLYDANPVGDPYAVLMLAVGRRPFIGRGNLRANLKVFINQGAGVMIIRGDTTGKSYSYELVQHVAPTLPGLLLRDVRFVVADGNGAVQLMSKIFQRVLGKKLSGVEKDSTSTYEAAALVDALVGKYVNDGTRRLLFIDGLDRTDLKPDVYEMVAALIAETFRGQLPNTQVILAGYSGRYDRDYEYAVIPDEVQTILESDVSNYFKNLALGRRLPDTEVAGIVQRVVTGESGVEALADRVRTETLALMAPVAANR